MPFRVDPPGDRWRWAEASAYIAVVEKMRAIAVMSAIAQPTRLEVLGLLARAGHAGLTAGDLAAHAGAAPNTMSAHLTILNRAGLVTAQKTGRTVVYRAEPDTVGELSDFLLRNCRAKSGSTGKSSA